jgi:hypothetical protein
VNMEVPLLNVYKEIHTFVTTEFPQDRICLERKQPMESTYTGSLDPWRRSAHNDIVAHAH